MGRVRASGHGRARARPGVAQEAILASLLGMHAAGAGFDRGRALLLEVVDGQGAALCLAMLVLAWRATHRGPAGCRCLCSQDASSLGEPKYFRGVVLHTDVSPILESVRKSGGGKELIA